MKWFTFLLGFFGAVGLLMLFGIFHQIGRQEVIDCVMSHLSTVLSCTK